jgi:hypothetical protein
MNYVGKRIVVVDWIKHGHARSGHISRTYQAWQNMKKRCYNPSTLRFERWGGRGIRVCRQWKNSFEIFLRDMGECPPGHSLDRLDNDGNYTPCNCRWTTNSEQALNSEHVRLLTYAGKTMAISVWAKQLGMGRCTLHARLDAGWSIERALTTPKRRW